MSREWDPGSLSMTTAALIFLPKYKKLAIALVLNNFSFLECCHISPHRFYMTEAVCLSVIKNGITMGKNILKAFLDAGSTRNLKGN